MLLWCSFSLLDGSKVGEVKRMTLHRCSARARDYYRDYICTSNSPRISIYRVIVGSTRLNYMHGQARREEWGSRKTHGRAFCILSGSISYSIFIKKYYVPKC